MHSPDKKRCQIQTPQFQRKSSIHLVEPLDPPPVYMQILDYQQALSNKLFSAILTCEIDPENSANIFNKEQEPGFSSKSSKNY